MFDNKLHLVLLEHSVVIMLTVEHFLISSITKVSKVERMYTSPLKSWKTENVRDLKVVLAIRT